MSKAISHPVPRARQTTLREWIRDHDEKWLFVALYLGLAVVLSVFVSLFWLLAVAGLHLVLECIRQSGARRGAADVLLHALWEIKLDIGLVLLSLTIVLYIDAVLGLLGIQSAARAAAVSRAGARIGSRAAAWERNIRTFLLTIDEMFRVSNAAAMVYRRKFKGERGPAGMEAGPADSAAAAASGTAAGTGTSSGTAAGTGTATGTAAAAAAQESPAGAPTAVAGANPPPPPPPPTPLPTPPTRPTAPPPLLSGARIAPVWRQRWGIGDRIAIGLVASGMVLLVAAPLLTPHDWSSAAATLLQELRPFANLEL